jgi:UDP-N-acetylmuramate--alanine ligase
LDFLLIPGQRIHIVGIGGFGLSAIARVLLETGYVVSGSDEQSNALTASLQADGATIYQGHDGPNVMGAELVIASSAIDDSNIELQAARAFNIPVLRRREAIGLITDNHRTIAVSGTHGKTTTTALMAHVLIEAGLEPSYIIGGVLKNTGSNAGAGNGDLFVIEADEYQGMFLGLTPAVAIVTNIEFDHPDIFPTFDDVVDIFRQFVACLPEDGLLVACADDETAFAFAQDRQAHMLPTASYGFNTAADWTATNIKPNADGSTTFIVKQAGGRVGEVTLPMAGKHNVQNALAVIATARYLKIPFATIAKAIRTFGGTGRRSEIVGQSSGVIVINDYAHHPTAIQVNLDAWANRPGLNRLWAVWQPHTYNRLRALAPEFAASFQQANEVLVTDVYSVRESVTPGLAPPDLVKMIQQAGQSNARYGGNLEQTADLLIKEVQPGDCVIIFSAGDAPKIGTLLLEALGGKN